MTTTTHAVREAKNRYARRRHKLRGYGQWQPFVDAEPARQHLRMLMDYGISIERAANVSGLYLAVLSGILYDFGGHKRREKIRPETEAKILAVQPRFEYIHDRHNVDGTATRRRLQALAAIGYPFRRLGDHLPLHPVQVGHTARSNKVQAGTHRAVATVYERLAHQDPTEHGIRPGTALKVRRYAQAQGWAPPIAWDEDTIGDPNAAPNYGDAVLNFHERAQLRREEIIHLAWCGHEPEEILARLNNEVSISTVRQIVQGWRTGQKRDRKAVVA